MSALAARFASTIFGHANAALRIRGVGGRRWKRNVARGARIGPWLQAEYEVIDTDVWHRKQACLYLVAASDLGIRYVGISRNGLKHRWRTSPAYDAETAERLPRDQLFHSQCWKHIESEIGATPGISFEVRTIGADALVPLLERLGPPLSAFVELRANGESVVAGVERWLCNHANTGLARWNIAMTGSGRASHPRDGVLERPSDDPEDPT